MGNSGSKYTPPPPTPMPIEDDVAAKHEAMRQIAEKSAGASRSANDLNGDDNDEEAVTRSKLGMTDSFAPQSQPRGPRNGRVHGPRHSPGSSAAAMTRSAVITG